MEGRFNRGFLRYDFGGLIFGGGRLYMEGLIFGNLRYIFSTQNGFRNHFFYISLGKAYVYSNWLRLLRVPDLLLYMSNMSINNKWEKSTQLIYLRKILKRVIFQCDSSTVIVIYQAVRKNF